MLRVLVVVLVAVMSGCAVFDNGNVPKTALMSYEGNAASKPTVSYSSTAMGGMSSAKKLPEAGQSIIEGEFLSVLEESNYFGRISKQDGSADITIEITLTNSGNPAAMVPAFITGLSLYIIPSWATEKFDLVAKAESQSGLSKEYVLADSATLVQWLPMIFAFPANNFSVVPEIRKNMYRKVLSDMKKDGFFEGESQKISLVR